VHLRPQLGMLTAEPAPRQSFPTQPTAGALGLTCRPPERSQALRTTRERSWWLTAGGARVVLYLVEFNALVCAPSNDGRAVVVVNTG